MNIAFDIDGVLTDFEWFLNAYGKRFFSKKYHTNAKVIDWTTSNVGVRFGYPNEEKAFYVRNLFWYANKMPIRENAASVIHRLREEGNKIYLITARALMDKKNLLGVVMRFCLKRWLRKNKIEYEEIFLCVKYR